MLDWFHRLFHHPEPSCPPGDSDERRPLKDIEKSNRNERLKSQMILEEARKIHREIATGNWAADALFNRTGRPRT